MIWLGWKTLASGHAGHTHRTGQVGSGQLVR